MCFHKFTLFQLMLQSRKMLAGSCPPMAGAKFSSIRLLVIGLLTWLGATPTKAVYSFEDQRRQNNNK
jgi:hypothetical protein